MEWGWKTMKTIRKLTFTEFQNRLRELGMKISPDKARALIDQGLFRGVVYPISKGDYLILEKKFEGWVELYADDVDVSDDIMEYLTMQKEATA